MHKRGVASARASYFQKFSTSCGRSMTPSCRWWSTVARCAGWCQD